MGCGSENLILSRKTDGGKSGNAQSTCHCFGIYKIERKSESISSKTNGKEENFFDYNSHSLHCSIPPFAYIPASLVRYIGKNIYWKTILKSL